MTDLEQTPTEQLRQTLRDLKWEYELAENGDDFAETNGKLPHLRAQLWRVRRELKRRRAE